MHIITLGDIKYDTFVTLPHASVLCTKKDAECTLCFEYGKKIPVSASFSQIGGTAPNVAIGLTRLGHRTSVVSSVGKDPSSVAALAFLKKEGVSSAYVRQERGVALTQALVITFQGESTQLVSENSTEHRFPKKIPVPDLLHISELGAHYRTLFADILAYHRKNNIFISINPGVLQIHDRSPELLALLRVCRVLFVNVREGQLLAKLPSSASPQKIITALHALGAHTVILTDGKNGAYASTPKETLFAPLFPGARKEATGAGDAFSTGVLGALLYKKSLETALAWGSINATSVVGSPGPTLGLLSRAKLEKLLRGTKNYSIKHL